jgi:anaerobic selenocysteine-containing dehydrogenase
MARSRWIWAKPVVDAVGEARSNADVFGELCERLGLLSDAEPAGELDLMLDVLNRLPPAIGEPLRAGELPTPSFGTAPVQFVDVFPNTPDKKVHLFPAALEAEAPMGLYRFQPDPGNERYPLALISPASDRTISSTLGELPRPDVKLIMHPDDAAARGLADDDPVRVFNELGEVHCILDIDKAIRPGNREPAEGHLAAAARAITRPAPRSYRTHSPISAAAPASMTRGVQVRFAAVGVVGKLVSW